MPDTILLIDHYAGSFHHGMEFRPFSLGRYWVRSGYRVIIVAASYSHLRKINPEVSAPITYETIDGIQYIWLRTPPYKGNGIDRIRNMLTFILRLFRIRHRLAEMHPLRAVIASSTYPLDIFPAFLIARRASAKLIFEVHDLWPLSPIELGNMSRFHPFIMIMQWAENFACSRSNAIVSILPKTISHLVNHGMPPGRFVHIPNGVDLSVSSEEEIEAEVASQIPQGKLIIGYAGTVGIANALHSLVEAAALLMDNMLVHFCIVGSGPSLTEVRALATEQRLTNITFIRPVAKRQIVSLLRRFDVCYIGFLARSLYRFGVSPNKIFDYMLAGRPILQANDAGNDIIGDAQCGITVRPDNPREIADAVLRFQAMGVEERSRLGENGLRFVREHHTYDRLAERFAELFAPGSR